LHTSGDRSRRRKGLRYRRRRKTEIKKTVEIVTVDHELYLSTTP
jgi:hypothetical protein